MPVKSIGSEEVKGKKEEENIKDLVVVFQLFLLPNHIDKLLSSCGATTLSTSPNPFQFTNHLSVVEYMI